MSQTSGNYAHSVRRCTFYIDDICNDNLNVRPSTPLPYASPPPPPSTPNPEARSLELAEELVDEPLPPYSFSDTTPAVGHGLVQANRAYGCTDLLLYAATSSCAVATNEGAKEESTSEDIEVAAAARFPKKSFWRAIPFDFDTLPNTCKFIPPSAFNKTERERAQTSVPFELETTDMLTFTFPPDLHGIAWAIEPGQACLQRFTGVVYRGTRFVLHGVRNASFQYFFTRKRGIVGDNVHVEAIAFDALGNWEPETSLSWPPITIILPQKQVDIPEAGAEGWKRFFSMLRLALLY